MGTIGSQDAPSSDATEQNVARNCAVASDELVVLEVVEVVWAAGGREGEDV